MPLPSSLQVVWAVMSPPSGPAPSTKSPQKLLSRSGKKEFCWGFTSLSGKPSKKVDKICATESLRLHIPRTINLTKARVADA